MKRIYILLSTLTSYTCLFAAGNEPSHMSAFTGKNYVRITVNDDFKTAAGNQFKVMIKSANDGRMLWQGAVKSTTTVTTNGQLMFITTLAEGC